MKHAILTWVAIGWALLLLCSLVSMMSVFMNDGDGEVRGLLLLQVTALPLLLVALLAYLWRARQLAGGGSGIGMLWRYTPGWLVFAVCSAASLTLIAELSFVLIMLLKENPQPWVEHVPAVTALMSSLAVALAAAHLRMESDQERNTEARPRR